MALGSMQFKEKGYHLITLYKIQAVQLKGLRKNQKTEGLSVVTVKKALGVNGTRIERLLADKNFSMISLKGLDVKR